MARDGERQEKREYRRRRVEDGGHPASSACDPQATIVHGTTLLRQAWNRKRRQVVASTGILTPRQRMIASSSTPAISVRHAIRVIGGMVATPIWMKV